jgi:hypothetical protein
MSSAVFCIARETFHMYTRPSCDVQHYPIPPDDLQVSAVPTGDRPHPADIGAKAAPTVRGRGPLEGPGHSIHRVPGSVPDDRAARSGETSCRAGVGPPGRAPVALRHSPPLRQLFSWFRTPQAGNDAAIYACDGLPVRIVFTRRVFRGGSMKRSDGALKQLGKYLCSTESFTA